MKLLGRRNGILRPILSVHVINDPSVPEALALFSAKVAYGRRETLHLVSVAESFTIALDYLVVACRNYV